jgi:predicted membrane metal-binding protein
VCSPEGWWGLKKLLLETFAVQMTVLPYILWMSGSVSLLSLGANLMTVPLVPLIMGWGFGATLISYIHTGLGTMIAMPAQWLLSYIIGVAHQIAQYDWAVVTLPPFSGWIIIVLYTGYVVIFMRRDILSLLHI